MKRVIATSLLGIAATVHTVHGQGALVFSNYQSPYVPIVYDAYAGVDPERTGNVGVPNVVYTTDGVQIEVWWGLGTGLNEDDLVFAAYAEWSAFDGYTFRSQSFLIPEYESGQTWTLQLRASGQLTPLGGVPVDTARSRGPLIETSNIADWGVQPPEITTYVYTPGFTVYGVCRDGPPVIWSQPADQAAGVGMNVEFSVSNPPDPCGTLQYQWQVDQVPIPQATNSTLIVPNVQVADSGRYRVEVTRTITNSFSTLSEEAMLQVLPPGAPSTEVNGRIAVGTVSTVGAADIAFVDGFPGGFLFYTLDGSTPTTNSPFYLGPFSLPASAPVRAMSLSADFTLSAYTQPVFVEVIPVYPLQTSVTGSGTVGRSPPGDSYASNTTVTLTATPSQHWAFDHWTGDRSGSDSPTTLRMDSPKTVGAEFTQTHYPVTISTPGGGVVTVNSQTNPPLTYYTPGTTLNLEAIPKEGWSFIEWQGAVQSTNPLETLTVTGTNVVEAVFGTDVITNVSGPGRIALSETNPVPYGTVLEITGIPEPGAYLLSWGWNPRRTDNPAFYTVRQPNPLLSASFGPVPQGTYTLITYVNGEGQILVDPIWPYYTPGSLVTLIASSTNPTTPFINWTGDATSTSNLLLVTVDANKVVSANFVSLPLASLSPTNLTVVQGSNALITASGAGSPPLHYQWWKDANPIAGATNASCAILDAQAADAGAYSVIVSNPLGRATSQVATVTVVFPPKITFDLFSQNMPSGSPMKLAVGADGTPPFSYRWFKDLTPIPGATHSSLVVDPIQTNDAGGYSVVVSNSYGSATSSVATVFVYVPVNIIAPPLSQLAAAHTAVQFRVIAEGFPDPTYQWFFDGAPIPGATLPTLTLSDLLPSNLGVYHVLIRNAYSSRISPPATLRMSPTISVPFTGATAIWGLEELLSVQAIGSGTLTYQWYKDGVAMGGATRDTLLLPNVQFTDAGLYSVVVNSGYGSATNAPAELVVRPAGISLGLYTGLTLTGKVGSTFTIDYATDLTEPHSWRMATNLTMQTEAQLWVDESVDVRRQPRRFYRVIPGP